jgi:hypothetical protein
MSTFSPHSKVVPMDTNAHEGGDAPVAGTTSKKQEGAEVSERAARTMRMKLQSWSEYLVLTSAYW